MSNSLKESLLSGDPLLATKALLEQVASKLDAGICTHCGGPRGEAAGMASLTRQAIVLLEKLDSMAENSEEEGTREQLAARRLERRRAAEAQNPVVAISDYR